MKVLENGLIVDFKETNIEDVTSFIDDSYFYGHHIEENKYLFPTSKYDYDNLEECLIKEFPLWNIISYTIVGVFN